MSQDLLIITILGRDRKGLVAEIACGLADKNINIIDIEQSVIHGLFSMFMLVDISKSTADDREIREMLFNTGNRLNVRIDITPYAEYMDDRLTEESKTKKITVLGRDKPGIVAAVSRTLFEMGANIVRIKMIARGELLAMDVCINNVDREDELKSRLRDLGERIDMDLILQTEIPSKFRKRMVVFDMDGTLVDAEIIDELAKAAGVGDKVSEITAKGMRGEIEFKESLRERVKLLKGVPVDVMEQIKDNIKLTPGSEELITSLKEMGYKLALISGGFTYFTNILKERLGFDYAFANEIVVKNGKLTGEIKGEIIDAKRKAEIVKELAEKENISTDEIVAIGDGANDKIMLQNAGLGIAFNAKDVLKRVADGSLTKNNLKGLLFCLGMTETELERIKSVVPKKPADHTKHRVNNKTENTGNDPPQA